MLRQNALHVGERRLHETAVARRPADERHELGTQMVAPVVSDPLHIPAVLQRAEQTKSRTFHQTQAAADFSEAEGMIGVPEQFEDIKRTDHEEDAVAGWTWMTLRCED